MEASDSRKRPLDGSSDFGVSKKSNPGHPEASLTDNVQFKVLIPAVVAGAIIGKGGETISDIQRDTGANVKMSKATDFYPGTSERVCLISGQLESVKKVHNFIVEKIRESKHLEGDNKSTLDRHNQVKVLVPNSTAGRIIGKNGAQVKEIKDRSGAYIQLSQKSREMNLPERCITIAGEQEACEAAVDLVLDMIVMDPQSSSCPNISYADYKGPIASANPTGSPFANGAPAEPLGPTTAYNHLGSGMNKLKLNSGNMNASAVETMRMTLRGTGYDEQAIEEIIAAVMTLAHYGLFGFSVNLSGLGLQPNMGGPMVGGNNSTLSNLANIVQSAANSANVTGYNQAHGGGMGGGIGDGQVYGPLGSTTTTGKGSGDGKHRMGGDPLIGLNLSPAGGFQGQNHNSFGLGPGVGGSGLTGSSNIPMQDDDSDTIVKELEVGEHIVGAIIGQGGRGIVEVQSYTGTNIQISKKGVFAPGTRNRVVTITGRPAAISSAEQLIQQRILSEEAKRARNSNL